MELPGIPRRMAVRRIYIPEYVGPLVSNLADVEGLLMRLQALIHDDEIVMDDAPEVRQVATMGGTGPVKTTGRRVLTIKIPYTITKKYIAQQINKMIEYKDSLDIQSADIEEYITTLTNMLTEIE